MQSTHRTCQFTQNKNPLMKSAELDVNINHESGTIITPAYTDWALVYNHAHGVTCDLYVVYDPNQRIILGAFTNYVQATAAAFIAADNGGNDLSLLPASYSCLDMELIHDHCADWLNQDVKH